MATKLDLKKITLGSLIQASRFCTNLTRDQLAEKVGISSGYLAHLENDRPVPLSDILAFKLHKVIGVHFPKKLRDAHNRRARSYYREYRKNKKEVEA